MLNQLKSICSENTNDGNRRKSTEIKEELLYIGRGFVNRDD